MRVIISQCLYFLTKDKWFSDFTHNMVFALCRRYPDYQFFVLSYDNDPGITLPENASLVHLSAPALVRLVWRKGWYRFKIKALLKQLKPDILISIHGCDINTIIPQYVIVPNAKQCDAGILHTAHGIIAPSFFAKDLLIKGKVEEKRIKIIRPFVTDLYKPVDWDEREKIKTVYAKEKEFFLVEGSGTPDRTIVNILKAFSVFKKWQQSNMQLLMINTSLNKETSELLKTYKYREDVQVLEDVADKRPEIIGSAMAILYLPATDDFGLVLAQALHCEVPVVSSDAGALIETGGDAVLYADTVDVKDIAEKLMRIFKDEKLRSQLVRDARTQVNYWSEENIFDLVKQ